jgi:hypothetical protein
MIYSTKMYIIVKTRFSGGGEGWFFFFFAEQPVGRKLLDNNGAVFVDNTHCDNVL